jgi:RNA polymerase sigma factor (sigma-70 family)
MVLGICRKLLRDRGESEDAAQETFLSAYRGLLAGTRPGAPGAWLATIARHECWARTRRRAREPEPVAEHESTDGRTAADPHDATVEKAELRTLWGAITNLPSSQRTALLMREVSGRSYAEVASELGLSESAVDALLARARRRLRQLGRHVFGLAMLPVATVEGLLVQVGSGIDHSSVGALTKIGSPQVARLFAGTAAVGLLAVGAVHLERHASSKHALNPKGLALLVSGAGSSMSGPASIPRVSSAVRAMPVLSLPHPRRPVVSRQVSVRNLNVRPGTALAPHAMTPSPRSRPLAPPVSASAGASPTTGLSASGEGAASAVANPSIGTTTRTRATSDGSPGLQAATGSSQASAGEDGSAEESHSLASAGGDHSAETEQDTAEATDQSVSEGETDQSVSEGETGSVAPPDAPSNSTEQTSGGGTTPDDPEATPPGDGPSGDAAAPTDGSD